MSQGDDSGSRTGEHIGDESLERGMELAFNTKAGGGSVLAAIERIAGRKSRVHLREPADPNAPILKMRREGVEDDSQYQIMGELARGGVGIIYRGRDPRPRSRRRAQGAAGRVPGPPGDPRPLRRGGADRGPAPASGHRPGVRARPPEGWAAVFRDEARAAAARSRRSSPAARACATGGRRLLRIFEQICHTVAYTHSRGVIHRDLKPANIMIGAFGEVQVMDWGFSKVLGQEERVQAPLPGATIVAHAPQRGGRFPLDRGLRDGHAGVHAAGAGDGPGRGARRTLRRVRVGRDPVRDPDRAAAVRRRAEGHSRDGRARPRRRGVRAARRAREGREPQEADEDAAGAGREGTGRATRCVSRTRSASTRRMSRTVPATRRSSRPRSAPRNRRSRRSSRNRNCSRSGSGPASRRNGPRASASMRARPRSSGPRRRPRAGAARR